MQNKKLVIISLISIVVLFIFSIFIFNTFKNSSTLSNTEKNNALLRSYSVKYGENKKNISVVEFLDPQCGSCALFNLAIRKLYKEYYEDIQIVVKYMSNHSHSDYVIKILEASREQNKYEEVLDVIFKTQQEWAKYKNENPELLWDFLKEVSDLNIEKLKEDSKEQKIVDIINQDMEDANILGVTGTPTVFVNGILLEKLSSKELFNLVEKEIYK